MKNAQLLILLIIVIMVASFVQRGINKSEDRSLQNNSTPTITQTPTPIPTEKSTPTVFKKSPTPTVQTQNNPSTDINYYKYPNSQVEESSRNRLVLVSTDDPNVITGWYIERLKSQNMKANSFVKTQTNKNVLNKLVSSNGSIKVSIMISKKNSDTNTKIVVEI